jgi:hypothetical protein
MLLFTLFLACIQFATSSAFLPATGLDFAIRINTKEKLLVRHQSKQYDTTKDVFEKYDLETQFGRWKYLKGIMEEEIGGDDVNVILLQVFEIFC